MSKQKHFYLIRGLIREAEHWGVFPPTLQARFQGAKVTTIDIPGAGKHYTSISPLSIEEMVEKMRAEFLEAKGDQEERVLVAVSLGGMIASCWLNHYCEDFHKVVLINTSFGGLSPVFHRLKTEALTHLLPVPFLKGRRKEAHILKLVSNNPAVFDETLELWDRICSLRPVSTKNTLRQLLAAARFNPGDFRPKIPVLLLASRFDRMVSVECSRAIARAWKVPLKEHPTAGHDLTADEPAWAADAIKSWVES